MTQSDGELVEGILKRDAHAFEILFNRYGEAVYSHLAWLVRDRMAADDLLQEVFLRVWGRAGQWNGQGPFKAWLFRIATNLALNHLRSVRRRREQPIQVPPDHEDEDDDSRVPGWMIDTATQGPDVILEQAEELRLLGRIVDDLPEEKREVIRMVHDEEMDIREIADRLEIPEGTVKSRLYHARRHLARQWRELDDPQEEP